MKHIHTFTEQVQPNWFAEQLRREAEIEKQFEALRRAAAVEMPPQDSDYEEWADMTDRVWEYSNGR